jgi:hypothetical protein
LRARHLVVLVPLETGVHAVEEAGLARAVLVVPRVHLLVERHLAAKDRLVLPCPRSEMAQAVAKGQVAKAAQAVGNGQAPLRSHHIPSPHTVSDFE